jgi:D-serine deaminase-like pyridoxal phosphate-dependent protein
MPKSKLNNKGFPISSNGKSFKSFLKSKPNIFNSEFQFPIMVIKESALLSNIQTMAEFCREIGAEIAPHVKTTMSPQIAEMQLKAGAWGVTVADFVQAEVFRNRGFKKIIIANEIVSETVISEISKINATNKYEIIFYVDSLIGLELIQKATPQKGKINLLIEIGVDSGRGGIRDLSLVREIAIKIKNDHRLKLRGVTGFEGAVPEATRTIEGENSVASFCQRIVAAAEIAFEFKSDEIFIVSAGGSAYFEIVGKELGKFTKPKLLLLRSGGYVTHDHIYYENLYPWRSSRNQLKPAIELWSQVISKPENNLGILNLGKRDVGTDLDNPIPILKFEDEILGFSGKIEKLNDQHAFLKSSDKFEIGTLIGLGISHPCTTFDKWRVIPLVNDNYDVVDLIETYF